MLYKALIIPHFDYASYIWGSASTSLLTDLQDIQTKDLYQLLKMKNLDENYLHGMAKIQTLENRQNEELLILIFNVFVLKHQIMNAIF